MRRGEKTKEQRPRGARSRLAAQGAPAARSRTTSSSRRSPAAGGAQRALAATLAANVVRNVWVHTIVFCGHIPEGAETFTEEQFEGESRGGWYVRQLAGLLQPRGQPALPPAHRATSPSRSSTTSSRTSRATATREIAPQVRAVCERHGLPYLSGRLGRQYRSVYKKVLRLAFPGGGAKPAAPPAAPAAAPEAPVRLAPEPWRFEQAA